MKLCVVASHPIQYTAPLFRALASRCDLTVYFAHRQSPKEQARAGYGVEFQWDTDVLRGFRSSFLENRSERPGVDHFFGCDSPSIKTELMQGDFSAVIVMGWHLKCYWQTVSACKRLGLRVLVRGDSQLAGPRSLTTRIIKKIVYPMVVGAFDAGLYVGFRNYEYLSHYGMNKERLFAAPHCVDNMFFKSMADQVDRAQIRRSLGLETNTLCALFVGRLVESKRPIDLVNALARLRLQGLDARALVVGSGPLEEGVRSAAARERVPITFLGFKNQTELPPLYRAADVLVLPSSAETWGLVVNEAIACGTPCVVSDACGCTPDMIIPGETGFSFPCGDVAAISEALKLCWAIRRDSEAMGRLADRYSAEAAADGIIGAVASIAGERRDES